MFGQNSINRQNVAVAEGLFDLPVMNIGAFLCAHDRYRQVGPQGRDLAGDLSETLLQIAVSTVANEDFVKYSICA